jgi:hypothetical protein
MRKSLGPGKKKNFLLFQFPRAQKCWTGSEVEGYKFRKIREMEPDFLFSQYRLYPFESSVGFLHSPVFSILSK